MTKVVTCFLLLTTPLPALAQQPSQIQPNPPPGRRVLLGIDLAKTIIPAIGGRGFYYPINKESFYTIEPTLRIERMDRQSFWVIQPGFTRFTGAPFGNASLDLAGGFLKTGVEFRPGHNIGLAVLLTISTWQTSGTFTLSSGAFSPYVGRLPTNTGFAGGLEIQFSRDIPLGKTSLFRLLLRTNSFWQKRADNGPATPYILGIGRSGTARNSELSLAFGATLEYHYYLRGHRLPPRQ